MHLVSRLLLVNVDTRNSNKPPNSSHSLHYSPLPCSTQIWNMCLRFVPNWELNWEENYSSSCSAILLFMPSCDVKQFPQQNNSSTMYIDWSYRRLGQMFLPRYWPAHTQHINQAPLFGHALAVHHFSTAAAAAAAAAEEAGAATTAAAAPQATTATCWLGQVNRQACVRISWH